MADPSAAERAYRRLKNDILAGALPAGAIDIRMLGDRLRMSVTPVREALARLGAERLVRRTPHHGYTLAPLSARRLENLYELSSELVALAIARCEAIAAGQTPRIDPARDARTYEAGMVSLVREIAFAQANLELGEHLVALCDRLAPARRCEPRLIPAAHDEMQALFGLWDKRQLARVRTGFARHFTSRIARVDAISRLLADDAEER